MTNLSILNKSEITMMDSQKLHEIINEARVSYGENPTRLNDFHARIADELEGEDYENSVVQNSNKTKSTFFNLTLEQCMLVGMRESKAVRRNVLAKLKEIEDQAAGKEKFNIPSTLSEALQLAADQARLIEEQRPKVEVYEKLAERKGDVSTTILAKQLGTSAIKLNQWLRDKGMKWKNADLPMAGYMDWFNTIADVKNGHEFSQCLITPLSQIEIAKRFTKL